MSLIKYPFKYISKGTDRIAARISKPVGSNSRNRPQASKPVDEIQNFIEARFICLHEACWRIFNFPIHHREPAVQIVAVHLENMQLMKFRGKHLTYLDFPSEFVWYQTPKTWKHRANINKPSIERISYIHPAFGEAFFLRMLLCHQKGCTSFADIRTVNQVEHQTYRSDCEAAGLLGNDKEWTIALEEASVSGIASQLRSLFAHILVYCIVSNSVALWEKHWKIMSDDIPLRAAASLKMEKLYINNEDLHNYVLYEVEILLNQCGKTISDFALPSLPDDLLLDLANRLIMEERNYDLESLDSERIPLESRMTAKQKTIYELVRDASLNKKIELVFVYGHGGTGKTFLWKAIITGLRVNGKIVLAVASSEIASLLLPSGRTAHSRFKLPIDLTDESMCNVNKNTQMDKLIESTDLIVWDEAPMNNKRCFEVLDRSLRDILGNKNSPFGGKSLILGGDFKQTLPEFKVFVLTENMRLMQPGLTQSEKETNDAFSTWLLDIGNGQIGTRDLEDPNLNAAELHQKVIVCSKNDAADTINKLVIDMVDGPVTTYASYYTATPQGNDGGESELLYPTEYLNMLNYPGLPPHLLELKTGIPAILLRNINVAGNLCNGTRMIITQLLSKSVEAEIITGTRVGEKVFFPRMNLIHKEPTLPYVLKRQQFLLKVSYAMTINKSQGQSLNKIGVYLPKPIFGHGQLYVALSRATSPDGLKILIRQHEGQKRWHSLHQAIDIGLSLQEITGSG
ncbi:uncharacterized protein [Rutidosis leptorrhynchoides]|uniref:uncharacterized protein n=1 Tax=Rutidosis leptorrhynchoides TaxID=125765 RepID=UPI003A990F40